MDSSMISVGNSPDKSNELSFYDNTDICAQRCSISLYQGGNLLDPYTDIAHTADDNSASNFTSSNNIESRAFREVDFNPSGYDFRRRKIFKVAEPSDTLSLSTNSPKAIRTTGRKSGSCFRPLNSMGDSLDSNDDCIKLLDMESIEDDDTLIPANIDSVFCGELHMKRTPLSRETNSGETSITTGKRIANSIKNDETDELKPLAESSINVKRWKSGNAGKENIGQIRNVKQKSALMFDSSLKIMNALTRDNLGLIGDFSKPFSLPLSNGNQCDLKSISVHTMAKLLNGDYQIDSYRIIDCRYPYEYNGGHIRGAENIFRHEDIIRTLLNNKTETETIVGDEPKRKIIIFHCEFSSERGPKLSRFLRRKDREVNIYPTLHYPEVYLLQDGYKEFFKYYPDLCDPKTYTPMLAPSHHSAYRYFRAQTKSWNCDRLTNSSSKSKKSRRFVL